MINVTTYLTQSLIPDDLTLKDKNVIVIDVLRATTTMTVALINGAKEIIPAENVPTAARTSKGAGSSLLCGERGGKIIEGFHLGNSPLEYTPETVTGKALIFCTTNGTASIMKSKLGKSCILAGFTNISSVVEYIKTLNEDFTIICSGKLNNFCLEDSVAAGVILNLLSPSVQDSKYTFDDSGLASIRLGKKFGMEAGKPCERKIQEMYRMSEHGKFLISLGFEEDLKICSGVDTYNKLPVFKNGVIKLTEMMESESHAKSKMKRVHLKSKEDTQQINEEKK